MTERRGTVTPAGAVGDVALVDREAELGDLLSALDRVVTGDPAAVLVVGACGVGKTRLVEEVIRKAQASEVHVLRGQCIGRGAEPLLPVRDALSSFFGSSPERITDVIKRVAPHLLELVPFVGRFLVPVVEAVAAGPQLGGASVQGVYAGLERVLHGLAERTGLCLLIEDVHEADQDTLYFLSYLVQKAAGTRALAVVTVDEGELGNDGLGGMIDDWLIQGWERVDVSALPREAMAAYVAAVSGRPPSPHVVDVLDQLTAGNALLLKELLPLVESGTVSALGLDLLSMTLPRRVQAVLNRRLLRLDRDLREFLEAASVCLETTHDFAALTGVLKLGDDEALSRLDQCARLGLLVETDGGEVSFVHQAMRLAVYATVPEASRRRLHGRAGEWYEAAGQVSVAAHHFARAGRPAEMVRTSLRAAELAGHVGMHRSAVALYEQAQPHCDEQIVGPPLARELIMLGRWDDAEALLRRLPDDTPAVRLLWSDLHFVRGRIRTAAEGLEELLTHPVGEQRLDCLIRLADIHLYLGDFETASGYATEALAAAEQGGSVRDQARGLGIVGATRFFAGQVDEAKESFRAAYELLDAVPESERDRTPYTVILDNLGQVAEIEGDWPAAEGFHSRALAIRREVFDARGLLHSLHALARTKIGMAQVGPSNDLLNEAEQLAVDLGEPLERAKIELTRAKLAVRAGQLDRAFELADKASSGFVECGTAFDIAHARLVRAGLLAAAGDERGALSEGAAARALVATRDFGLLRHTFPHLAFGYEDRIARALRAYACGDAFGLPWEGAPPTEVDIGRAVELPARPGWERGATSDDTALTLLVAEVLTSDEPEPATVFLRLLCERAPSIRGMGPSTTAAIRAYTDTGKPPASGSATNGAAMRALPVGWLVPTDDPDRRRALTLALSAVTHPSSEAQCAACVMSLCAAWSLEGASIPLMLELAQEEAAAHVRLSGADRRIEDMLTALRRGRWSPPPAGVSLDAYDTVTAALWCVSHAETLGSGLEAAVALGGDTDTVAALVGGLLASSSTADVIGDELPWAGAVSLPDDGTVARLAAGLASARVRAACG